MNSKNKRILIVDDNVSIHDDFKKILAIKSFDNIELAELESLVFNEPHPTSRKSPAFWIDDAYQGEEAILMVHTAEQEGDPYALIFMDVRMPPGIDGIETISRIWKNHPNIEVVICTAYSDYSWDDIMLKFGETDKLLFSKKPFNVVAIKQLAHALTTKWELGKKNREYLELLEDEVRKRTDELNRLLLHMQKLKEKAESSDKMKSVFLSNMSHEIRNPLNSILGFTELLENKKDMSDEKKIRYLQTINNSGKSLLRLINDIIDLAKIEAGHLTVENEVFDLNQLFHDLENFYTLEAKEKKRTNLKIIIDVSPNDGSFFFTSDQYRLKQIISNLLNNAIKFTTQGFVKFGYKKLDSNEIYFFVEDTGIGIVKEKHESIFQRFIQAEMSIEERNGTGLGLAIVKNLVQLLGGNIQLKSESSNGSLFYFTLPFENNANQEVNIGKQNKNQNTDYNWKGKSILFAEDEASNYLLLKEIFEPTLVDLIWVKDGAQAIDLIDSGKHFDLVLTDIRMPNKDGHALLEYVKSKDKDAIVIAQSGYAMVEERKKYLSYGFDEYLEKPIDIVRLLNVINSYIG